MNRSLHRWRLIASLAALAIALTGCSSAAPTGESTSTAKNLLPPAEGTTSYPLTLGTLWGETVLKKRPERIVALGPLGAELVVALGATPVATDTTIERDYWVQQAVPAGMDAVTVYDEGDVGTELDYEQIAASKPDLIISTGDLSDSFDKLSAIAPVVGAEAEDQLAPGEWRGMLASLGRAIDLGSSAADVVTDYDAYFANVRKDNPQFAGHTVTYAIQYNEEYGLSYSSSKNSPVEQFFLDLGFTPNPLAAQFEENQDLSPEQVGQLDADVLIVAGTAGEAETKRLLIDTPLFQNLRPVKANNWAVFYNTDKTATAYSFNGKEKPGNINWAMAHGGGPIGKQWAAEQLVPILRQAAEGN